MAAALARDGHEVHVVTYHLGEDAGTASFPIHRVRDIPTYRRMAPGPSYQKLVLVDPLLALKLRSVLRRHRIDVIHAHHYEGLLVALAAGRGAIPLIFDVHTLLESELPYYKLGLAETLKRRVGRLLDARLPRRADHVIAVTDDIRDRLLALRAVKPERVSVIPNGGDYEVFEAARPATPRDADGPKTLIFTGNLAAYQGIDLMLRAFKAVREARQDVRLLVATEDSFDAYERLASDLGVRPFIEVRRTGFEEIPSLLAAATVALNPRVECDGLPQKLLNYMAAGKAVVSFAGSAKHLVGGEHGLVVEDRDVAAFARAVERLLDDPALAARLGQSGREMVRTTLTWETTARRVQQVYERVS